MSNKQTSTGDLPTPASAEVMALAQAMMQTSYVPGPVVDQFHAQVAAGVLIRELRALGWSLVRLQ